MALGRKLVAVPMTLGTGFVLVLAWSLSSGWKLTFGPLFQKLGDLGLSFSVSRVHVSIHPFRFLHAVDRNVRAWLSEALSLSERGFVKFLTAAVEPFVLAAGVVLALGLGVHAAIKAMWTQIDRLQAAALGGASRGISALVHKIVNSALSLERRYWHKVWARTDARARHAQAVADNAFEFPRPRLGKLDKTKVNTKDLNKWLRRTLLGTLGATIVLSGLKALRLGWLRCTKVNKVGNRLCGMNQGLFDDLLSGTLVLASTVSIVGLAEACGKFIVDAEDGITYLIRELK